MITTNNLVKVDMRGSVKWSYMKGLYKKLTIPDNLGRKLLPAQQ